MIPNHILQDVCLHGGAIILGVLQARSLHQPVLSGRIDPATARSNQAMHTHLQSLDAKQRLSAQPAQRTSGSRQMCTCALSFLRRMMCSPCRCSSLPP